jgi:hypothetical protein
MGSTGSGTFSDYQGYKGGSNQGGASNDDKCAKAFFTDLEEVANCDFFAKTNNVPPKDSIVYVNFGGVRIEIINAERICIGYLPTKYNYLLACMNSGIEYTGIIVYSTLKPMPFVNVAISPIS